jgi:arginine repressor
MMKKVDILNFITDFRKAPNQVKTYHELITHLGSQHEATIQAMITEMKQLGVIRETESQGEKAYQVAKK